MNTTPYARGYKHGRSGKKANPSHYRSLLSRIAYIHGHINGSKERNKDN